MKKKHLVCLLFGHRMPRGYAELPPYLTMEKSAYIDGIGRGHVRLDGKCDRCGEKTHFANMHVYDQTEAWGKMRNALDGLSESQISAWAGFISMNHIPEGMTEGEML